MLWHVTKNRAQFLNIKKKKFLSDMYPNLASVLCMITNPVGEKKRKTKKPH